MKNKFFNCFAGGALLLWSGLLSGCSDTEVIRNLSIEEKESDLLVFNVCAPESFCTRASSDHVLRFTAKLFEGKYRNNTGGVKYLATKQATATADGKSTIVFQVPEGEYQILLFADYIPINSEPDENGIYPDAYYNTTSKTESIEMIAFTRRDDPFDNTNINNENYDCFYAETELIKKTADKYEKDFTLKRAVAKVRVISNTTNTTSDIQSISFSKFSYGSNFSIDGQSVLYNNFPDYLSSRTYTEMTDPSQNEIFYFYSLAPISESNNKLTQITFTVNFKDGTKRTIDIPSGIVTIKQNYITTIRGNFLADPEPELGDIILHLDSDENWDGNTNISVDY